MPRMRILNSVESEQFDAPPDFNAAQRKYYFDFPVALQQIASTLRTPLNRLCFLVSCGYFKATKRFSQATLFHERDLVFVATRIGVMLDDVSLDRYDKQTAARHQQIILDYYGYTPYGHGAEKSLSAEITSMVRSQLKPRLIFWRCVDWLAQQKIQAPGYFKLAELILQHINQGKQELADIIARELTTTTRQLLDALFIQESLSSKAEKQSPGKTSAYRLTLLKKLSQSTRPAKIRESIADLQQLGELYHHLEPVVMALNLSHQGIRYYANSVIKSEIFQISRRTTDNRYLHVIAFIVHQYYRLQDNLVDILLASVQSFNNTAIREHKEWCYAQRIQQHESIRTVVTGLDQQVLETLSAIEVITLDPMMSDQDKVGHIRTLLQNRSAQRLKLEQDLADLKIHSDARNDHDKYHEILETKSIRLQNRVSLIVKHLNFKGELQTDALLQAIDYFKHKQGVIGQNPPMAFLDTAERETLQKNGQRVRGSLYKVFLFRYIQKAIKSGTLNLKYSYKYRALDDYLISRERWQQDKQQLLERAALLEWESPHDVLGELDRVLYRQYSLTNQHIQSGRNTWIKLGKNGLSTIKTPKRHEQERSISLSSFFPKRHYISLLEVLSTMNRYSGFLEELQHWRQRYQRDPPANKLFYAGIIGLGCHIGTRKMAVISRDIDEASLESTVNWYFSLENLRAANDRILHLINQLGLPDIYLHQPDQRHTASDGQKFTVRSESLNANYSFKYFGKEQGLTVGSFIDERGLLFHSLVFSAAERESAYIIDGLMHNDVVKSDIHSSDTHGYSEAIFGVTHLLGISYAPRIKNLKHQQLYLFHNKQGVDTTQWAIKPDKYVKESLVYQQWDDVLRLITTIKLKEIT
nr:Tn3 family transposase [Gammaproteobacteria bacterium]